MEKQLTINVSKHGDKFVAKSEYYGHRGTGDTLKESVLNLVSNLEMIANFVDNNDIKEWFS